MSRRALRAALRERRGRVRRPRSEPPKAARWLAPPSDDSAEEEKPKVPFVAQGGRSQEPRGPRTDRRWLRAHP